jgi:hypothetical protein
MEDLGIVHSADALDVETVAVARRENGRAPALAADSNGNVSSGALIMHAIEKGLPAAELKELFALHERMQDREAAMEFNRELAAFRKECPKIQQNRTAQITTTSGGSYSFTYAELDEITRIVDPLLVKHGFSYTWDSETNEKAMLTSTFILTHVNGHSRRTHFTVPTDNKSGMSPQQKIGAADSFAKRKSMCNGLGIVTTDNEVDPQADAEANSPPITDEQAREIVDLIHASKTSMPRLLAYLEIESIDKLAATKFDALKRQLLERKAEREATK